MKRETDSKRRRTLAGTLLGLLVLGYIGSASAELVLTAPPRETPERGEQIYAPLAEHLSALLGEPVVYRHPGDWITYGKTMRSDGYDIVFDGPHFVAWRHERLGAVPVVKLPGSLQFVLVIDREQTQAKTPEDLIGKSVCHLPSPNLGTLTLYSMFPEPARQPEFVAVRGGFVQVAESVAKGKCVAGILRDNVYQRKLRPELKERLAVVRSSSPLTNQSITVSQRVPEAKRKLIIESLTSGGGVSAAKPILDRFSKGAKSFEFAGAQDFDGHNLLYDQMIFGW